MGFGRWYCLLPVPEITSAATDLALLSYLLLLAVLGILSGLLAITTVRSANRLLLNCGGPHRIRRSLPK